MLKVQCSKYNRMPKKENRIANKGGDFVLQNDNGSGDDAFSMPSEMFEFLQFSIVFGKNKFTTV